MTVETVKQPEKSGINTKEMESIVRAYILWSFCQSLNQKAETTLDRWGNRLNKSIARYMERASV